MHFLLFSKEIFESFLKTFPDICVFRQKARKFNSGLEIILKIEQNNAFFLFSTKTFENFLKIFPNNYVFRPKRENLVQGFLIF